MAYVPGNAVEGYCLVCKADTVQTVLEVEGLQIRLVRCEKCSGEGPFRVPRARTKAGLREVAAKRRTTTRRTRRKPEDPARTFRKLLEGKDLSAAARYSPKAHLEVGQLVEHPRFGIGVVTAVTDAVKASIAFEDRPRVLVCNRK